MKKLFLTLFFLNAAAIALTAQTTIDTCRMKIGMNIAELAYYTPEQPFVDLMKNSNEWTADPTYSLNVSASIPLDADGYPLQLPYTVGGTPQTVYTLIMVKQVFGPGGIYKYPAGTYTVLYDGKGKLRFAYDATVTAQSAGVITLSVTPTTAGIIMFIDSSVATDHIRNIRVIMPGYQTNYLSQPFHPAFLNKIAPFPVLRLMGLGQINNSPNQLWSNRASPAYYTQGTRKGCAYEYMIKLGNIAKKDLWVNVPHMADSAYIANMAKLFKDSLDPQLKVYLEYSNEVWNTNFNFVNAYNWVDANGPFSNGSDSSHSKNTAYFAARAFRIWTNTFGTQTASRLVRVAACFTEQPERAQYMMNYFNNYNWQFGNTNCKVDAVAPGLYFGLDSILTTAPLNAMGASATPDSVIKCLRNEFEAGKQYLKGYNAIAKQNNLKLVMYEGGQHLVTGTIANTAAHKAVYDAQVSQGMYNLYRDYIKFMKDSINTELFMHLGLAWQRENTYGSWGVVESIYQDTSLVPAPKYRALINHINSCQTAVAINEITNKSDIVKVFPNPASGIFSFVLENTIPLKPESDGYRIEIYNVVGEKIYHKHLYSGKTEINLSREAKGIYFYKIFSEGKFISGGKLIVQ